MGTIIGFLVTKGLSEKMARVVAMGGLVLAIVLAVWGGSCAFNAAKRAQGRVDAGQHGAALDSGKDALNVQQGAAVREAASEALSRDNEKDIRSADGAADRVKAPVDAAGRAALCRRDAYKGDPKCAAVR